jgi:SanA protein
MVVFPFAWRAIVRNQYASQIYRSNSAPSGSVAIVFGAAVRGDRLSTVLRDRMDTAIQLYKRGLVEKILVSGDGLSLDYNEPRAMIGYAITRGVPGSDLEMDLGGRRTYDTCYRSVHTFGFDSAILVTQAFHLPRALFTCRALGLDSIGVEADLREYRASRWYEFRETLASSVALWNVIRKKAPPDYVGLLPIEESIAGANDDGY